MSVLVTKRGECYGDLSDASYVLSMPSIKTKTVSVTDEMRHLLKHWTSLIHIFFLRFILSLKQRKSRATVS